MSETTVSAEAGDLFERPRIERDAEKLELIREVVLETQAARLQAELDEAFHLDPSFAVDYPDEAAALKEDFLRDKQGLNIGERFALTLSEKYFGKIHVIKLGSTDHSRPDESRRLFDEVNDLRDWMARNIPHKAVFSEGTPLEAMVSATLGEDDVDYDAPEGDLAEDEDPGDIADRLRSGRWMEYEYIGDKDDGPDGYRAVINRVRPFVKTRSVINGALCDVALYKETVITIPADLLKELMLFDKRRYAIHSAFFPEESEGPDGPISNPAMIHIERLMYTSAGKDVVQRIHTAIFSSVVPVKASV